jgi:RND family efflux transporter MFP subunit
MMGISCSRKRLIELLVVVMFPATSVFHTGMARGQQPPAPVVVSPAVYEEIAAGETFVGTLLPIRQATIGSAVDGRVVELNVEAGEPVQAGQALAQLLTETISLDLEAAEAELEFRKQQLAEFENGSRPEDIERARAKLVGAKARAEYARAYRERLTTLFANKKFSTEREFEESIALAVEAEQNEIDAQAALKLAIEGPRKETIAQARAQVRMAQAAVDKLRDQIKKHTVISRFDGYVTAKHSEIGQWVTRGDPIVNVAALDPVEVQAFVLEKHIAYVKLGTTVRVSIPALPEQVFTGKVTRIVPQADARTRTFPVIVRVRNSFDDGVPLLKSGMYARVTLPTGLKHKALLVPKDAVVLGGEKPLLYVVDLEAPQARQGKVRPVPVDLGVAWGQLIQVDGPLTAGGFVVVQGNERLRPGQEVVVSRVLEPEVKGISAASPPAAPKS